MLPASMSQSDLVTDLQTSLHDSGNVFTAANGADYARFLDRAALDLGRFRRRTLASSITIQADVSEYAAPPDMVMPKLSRWGVDQRMSTKPWESTFPGLLPRLSMVGDPGSALIVLTPSPTQDQILVLGSTYRFYYFAGHIVGDGVNIQTTVRPEDRGLLLLRAQAEAMKELAARNANKPVRLQDGMHSAPKNGTPAALFDQLMREFESQAVTC